MLNAEGFVSVTNVRDGAEGRELVMARWGMPSSEAGGAVDAL